MRASCPPIASNVSLSSHFTCGRARAAGSRSSAITFRPRRSSPTTRTSRRSRTRRSSARAYLQAISTRLGLTSDSIWGRARVEQRLSPAALPAARRSRVLGIDPAANVAEAAEARGVPTLVDFFDTTLPSASPRRGRTGDLIIGNDVLAQVPDLNDFVRGLSCCWHRAAPGRLEFPRLARLLEGLQGLTTPSTTSTTHTLAVHDQRRLRGAGSRRRRRRGAGEPRRLAARPRGAHGAANALHRRRRRARARRRGSETRPGLRRLHEDVKKSTGAPRAVDRVQARREADRRLWRARQGEHAAQLLRYRPNSSTTRSTATRTSAGASRRARRSRSCRSRHIGGTWPDVIVILPWNLARQISAQLAYTAAGERSSSFPSRRRRRSRRNARRLSSGWARNPRGSRGFVDRDQRPVDA